LTEKSGKFFAEDHGNIAPTGFKACNSTARFTTSEFSEGIAEFRLICRLIISMYPNLPLEKFVNGQNKILTQEETRDAKQVLSR
jgi:hypothetical protein